jgi:hypothetical protein
MEVREEITSDSNRLTSYSDLGKIMFQHGAVPHIVFNNENFERLVVLHISDYIGLYSCIT